MKNLILLITFLLPYINFAQEIIVDEYLQKINLQDYKLKGKVEKIISTAIDKNGKTTTLPFLENEFYNQITLEFNKKGQLTKRINYLDYSGKLAIYSYTENNYDNKNRINQQKTTVINNGEDPLRIASLKEFYYDNKNRILTIKEELKGKSSTSTYQTDFIYNNQLNEIITKHNNEVISKNVLLYNKNGDVNKNEVISVNGKKGLRKYYIYDKEIPIFLEENNNGKKQITFITIEDTTSTYQQFDQNQNLQFELVKDKNNQIISAKKQSFNQGKSILNSYHLTYDLDLFGNWTYCNIFKNNELNYQIKREIIYYK